MHVLSAIGGLPLLGPIIDVGVLVSLFAGSSLASLPRRACFC